MDIRAFGSWMDVRTQMPRLSSGVAPANQTKKSQFMNFSQGRSGTKVQCESCLFSQGKTPEFTKMGEIHELFVLTLSLVWFAGATPDFISTATGPPDPETDFYQKKRDVRKISARNSGAGNGCANFMGAWHFLVLSAGKPPCP